MSHYQIEETIDKIIEWGLDRNIIQNATSITQAIKTLEETTELLDAVNAKKKGEIKDAIGDIFVTLVMVASIEDMNIEDCINSAYNEIKDRKGILTPEGCFIKEE